MHHIYKETSVEGRYVTIEDLNQKWFKKLPKGCVMTIGKSVNGQPIYGLMLGEGKRKIMMWSQMHGNESTTTKAVLDMVNFLISESEEAKNILENCQLLIIPILNPDGAAAYTRVNANSVDLNRDALDRSQPETQVLWSQFDSFQPDFCFNLHDQRTLFSAGDLNKVATVSFLSPASDSKRSLTPTRTTAMKLIVGMNNRLQQEIPGHIGRYDDAFNANCVGDSFQMQEVPTILFEAGHYPKDYQREETRKFIYLALMEALGIISADKCDEFVVQDYLKIPENEKWFYDILVKNADVVNPNIPMGHGVGIRFVEELNDKNLDFRPKIEQIGRLESFFGHHEMDCNNAKDFESLSDQKEILELILGI